MAEVDIDAEDRIDDIDVDMGSDEVSCEDIVNKRDLNGDGLVNYFEFAIFADAWLAHDPNDPGDPDPDPEKHAIWAKAKRCNFDEDYDIDIDDLMYLANDWLWQACWKRLDKGFAMMSMGGGMEMMSLETAEAPQPVLELTVKEQIERTENNLDWLNNLWETDEGVREIISKDRWEAFIEKIEAWLDELEEQF